MKPANGVEDAGGWLTAPKRLGVEGACEVCEEPNRVLENMFFAGVEPPKFTLGFAGRAEVPKRLLVGCAVVEEVLKFRPELEVGAAFCRLSNGLLAAAAVGAAPKVMPELAGAADVEPNWKGVLCCC